MKRAPILLCVYNRPWHTRMTVDALKSNLYADESELFIFSDAPKNNSDIENVQKVRDYINSVSGFKAVKIVKRPENMGLASSITDAVTQLCNEYGNIIVIEDDLVTSPYFLEYMNSALERYEDDEIVMQIAGYMFPVELELKENALFLPFISSWGWATWSRAWEKFDAQASGYKKLLDDTELRKKFDLNGRYKYFDMLTAQQQGKIDSWAIRWYLSVFMREGLALYPVKSLVKNIGFDGSGVNCAVSEFVQSDLDELFRVSSMPDHIEVFGKSEIVYNSMASPRLSLLSVKNRLIRSIKSKFFM